MLPFYYLSDRGNIVICKHENIRTRILLGIKHRVNDELKIYHNHYSLLFLLCYITRIFVNKFWFARCLW